MSISIAQDGYPVPSVPPFGDLVPTECRSLFKDLPRLRMRQAWAEKPEAGFQSAWVSVGASEAELIIYTELVDDWICNPASTLNELSFLKGDTFEIFLKNARRDDYWELHVTPEEVLTQLHFPRHVKELAAERGVGTQCLDLAPYFVWGKAFQAKSFRTAEGWGILAMVPLGNLDVPESGRVLEANFARYDYSQLCPEPLLSATGDFSKPVSFHEQGGWHKLFL